MARTHLLIALLTIIAIAASACFTPIPNPSQDKAPIVTVTATPARINIGENSTIHVAYQDEVPSTVTTTIGLQQSQVAIVPPAAASNLDFVRNGHATLQVNAANDTQTTIDSVPSGSSEVLGRAVYTLPTTDGIALLFDGASSTVGAGKTTDLGGFGKLTFVGAKISNVKYSGVSAAYFTVAPTGTNQKQSYTVRPGTPTTVDLDGLKATLTIVSQQMDASSSKLVSLKVHVTPTNPLYQQYEQNITFPLGAGKRVDLGPFIGTYDVYLDHVDYTIASASVDNVTMTLNQESKTMKPDVPYRLGGHVIIVTKLSFANGAETASANVNDETLIFPQATSGPITALGPDSSGTVGGAQGSATESKQGYDFTYHATVGRDPIFLAWSIGAPNSNGAIVVKDLASATLLSSSGPNATYRFNMPGSYTVYGTATDEAGHSSQDTTQVVVT